MRLLAFHSGYKIMKQILFLLICLSSCLYTAAQDEIETSPDEYETPSTVPASMFQAESRFRYTKSEKEGLAFDIPSLNLKYGINDLLEIIVVTNLVYNKVKDSTSSGLEPLIIGLKVKLWEEKGFVPQASLSVQAALPKLASEALQASYLAPNIKLLFKNKVTESVSIGYNTGVQWDGNSPSPEYFYSFSPKLKLSDKLEMFVESYGYLSQESAPEHWGDTGLMYLISKNVQAEVSAGYEFTSINHFHQYFCLAGFAFRI
jgi:hypothetical protein